MHLFLIEIFYLVRPFVYTQNIIVENALKTEIMVIYHSFDV